MAIRKIRQCWYCYFRDVDGTRRTRSLKTRDEATARQREKQYMDAVNLARFNLALSRVAHPEDPAPVKRTVAPDNTPAPGEHKRGGISLADMWACASRKRALSRGHASVWKAFLSRIGVKYADQVTPQGALEYLETHYASGNGKNYNNAKSVLNTIFRCCLVEAGLSASPFAPIVNRRVTEVDHHRNLTEQEFNAVFAAAPLQLQIMMMLSRWTCQRLETCARMTPQMFDFTRKVFLIMPGKTARYKKYVCCPIMPELEAFIKPILAKCRNAETPIVAQFSDQRVQRYTKQFHEILMRLGIKDTEAGKASFHSIRGTAITYFRERVPSDTLRLITGHASDAVEDIYARPVENISRIALEAARK